MSYFYDRFPFAVTEYQNKSKDFSEISLLDTDGAQVYTEMLVQPEYFTASEGYLTKVVTESICGDGIYTYEFYYDNASPEPTSTLQASYKQALKHHPETTEHSFTFEGNEVQIQRDTTYTLYDIDKNGTAERIVCEDESCYYFYAYNGTEAVFLGHFY